MKKPARAAAKTTKKAATPSVDSRLQALAKLFAGEPRVKLEKAFSSVALKADDKIFVMVVSDQLVLKLPKARVEALIASGAGLSFETGGGRVMKEWVRLTGSKPSPATLAREAFAFVSARK